MNPAARTTLPLAFPPELFPIIASFVPLRSAPRTLLALALANHRFYNIFRPLLYSRLILRNENDATAVFQRIMDEPRLGLFVRELYIMAALSIKAQKGEKRSDIVAGLQMLIAKGLIPRITALGLYWLKDWTYDRCVKITLCRRLRVAFWSDLRTKCPRLRTLILRNIGQSAQDPWLTGPVIDAINAFSGLSVLRLEWNSEGPERKEDLKILNNLPRLASSLHTLSLRIRSGYEAPILSSLEFPNLKRLRLHQFSSHDDTEKVHWFFNRHPQLVNLSLEDCSGTWFSEDVDVGFLPNLKHLKARFKDIRLLLPILPHLVSLGFTESYNLQVPYLLRAALRNGLPHLRSLEIEQRPLSWDALEVEQRVQGWRDRTLEGVLWYEGVDGQFHTAPEHRRHAARDFMHGYMHSLVRGAPNLEELGLHGMALTPAAMTTLGPTLSQLVKLERFYYRGFSPDPKHGRPPFLLSHPFLRAEFLAGAEVLARVCARLESVTSISGKSLPYASGVIARNAVGDVTVRPVDGVGLLISADENDPFPCNA